MVELHQDWSRFVIRLISELVAANPFHGHRHRIELTRVDDDAGVSAAQNLLDIPVQHVRTGLRRHSCPY